MARTVKVTKEKAMKERAGEAGDKKIKKRLEKLREENKMRAQHINERKRKQLKAIRDEKLEKQRKVQRGMQALKEIQKYQKGADLLIRRVPFSRLVREIVQKRREGLNCKVWQSWLYRKPVKLFWWGSWNKQICALFMQRE